MKFLLPFCCLILMNLAMRAQTPVDSLHLPQTDSLPRVDSVRYKDSVAVVDSVKREHWNDSLTAVFSKQSAFHKNDPFFLAPIDFDHFIPRSGQDAGSGRPFSPYRETENKDLLFYGLILLLLFFAVIRNAFPKYFSDLFRLFFRTTLKQRQIREQLMQTPLPSLLSNGLFVLSAGLYLAFMARYFKLGQGLDFWLLYIYIVAGLSVVYFVKFIGLKFTGWLFQQPDAAESYLFIVFVVNKMIGILLLPFLAVLAFSGGNLYIAGLNLSALMLAALFIYRFILTYGVVRNQIRVNPFHFLLYLCAFEVAPLFLIYKGLLLFFEQSA